METWERWRKWSWQLRRSNAVTATEARGALDQASNIRYNLRVILNDDDDVAQLHAVYAAERTCRFKQMQKDIDDSFSRAEEREDAERADRVETTAKDCAGLADALDDSIREIVKGLLTGFTTTSSYVSAAEKVETADWKLCEGDRYPDAVDQRLADIAVEEGATADDLWPIEAEVFYLRNGFYPEGG